MNRYDEYKLGETTTPIAVSTQLDNRALTLAFIQQARRSIHIYAPTLDPAIYNQPDLHDALYSLATQNRHAKIFILIEDPQKIIQRGHLLVELSRKIPSYMEIRNTHIDYREATQCYLIADQVGIITRSHSTRYDGNANFNNPLLCKETLTSFALAWEHSSVDAETRRLHL